MRLLKVFGIDVEHYAIGENAVFPEGKFKCVEDDRHLSCKNCDMPRHYCMNLACLSCERFDKKSVSFSQIWEDENP